MGVLGLCPARTVDFEDACVRETWAALLPAALVAVLLVLALPLPAPLRPLWTYVAGPFRTYITLPEAEAYLDGASAESAAEVRHTTTRRASGWRTPALCAFALIPALGWAGVASFNLASRVEAPITWADAQPFVLAGVWAYAALRAVLAPTPTPAYGLFTLYAIQLFGGVVVLGGMLYGARIGEGVYLPTGILAGHIADVVASTGLLLVSLTTPIALPSSSVNEADVGKSVSPEDYTTLWGWLSFSWVTPLVDAGTSATLDEKDVWNLSPTMQSKAIFSKFAVIKRKTLLRRLWVANSLDVIVDCVLALTSVLLEYTSPFFLNLILAAIASGTTEARTRAYIYAVLALVCNVAKAQTELQHLWFSRRAATRVRSELMAAIYEKALKRRDFSGITSKGKDDKGKDKDAKAKDTDSADDEAKAGADVGKIVNLMSGDANRVSMYVAALLWIYTPPLQIAIALTFLYRLLGLSAFAGLATLALGWPLNSAIMRQSLTIQKGTLAARDKRMGVVNELIGAIKFIKFFAWEDRWIDRALDARAAELRWMLKARTNNIVFTAIWAIAPGLVALTSFATFVALGGKLDVATAFTALALFGMIRQPLNLVPMMVVQTLQTLVALNRIAVYLAEDEVTPQVSSIKREGRPTTAELEEGLGFESASFKWNEVQEKEEDKDKKGKKKGKKREPSPPASEVTATEDPQPSFELRDLSVRFPEGKLTVVTGPTASGKTALLMALLGEMTLLGGKLVMAKDPAAVDPASGLTYGISYAAQSPWLRHQSIKDNILFGQPLDEERYEAVIEACALRTDLRILEDGDSTEIGARGVSLSGGQKARVALARAVYARTKYVLLDDPLSAVDSHTARFLFEELLCGPLLAGRTVILVTHHVELVLPGAQYLIRMLDGRVDTHGSIPDLRAAGVLDDIVHAEAAEAVQEENTSVGKAEAAAEVAAEGEAGVAVAEAKDVAKDVSGKKPRKLIEDEKREEGSVKWGIYKTYLQASSYSTWAILAVLVVITEGLGVAEKFWLRIWGDAYGDVRASSFVVSSFSAARHNPVLISHVETISLNSYSLQHVLATASSVQLPDANDHPMFYVGIFAAIGLGSAFIAILSSYVQLTGALKASRRLFQQLLVGVVRATMRWHDVTPQGRMLNRFSKDVETVDGSLGNSLQAVNTSFASFLASILTVAIIFPPFLLPAAIIGYLYFRLAIGYLNTGRDLRRMESNTRSPIFSDFSELLEGIVTVRAFSAEARFLDDLHGKVDLTTQMWYGFWMTNRWLLVRFDSLGAVIIFITTLFALGGFVDAGLAGICITSAMSFTMGVYWTCRFWTALELDLNSVERLVEYLDLPQEPAAVIENSRPPAYWPSASTNNALIKVEDLVVRYAPELPPVLHGISFELRAKERIGLLGRTGSGKSTLAMSVLRFVDPASGRILIDGVDITSIGVHDLRARITFIPQDAALFSGTLRENLDPFNEHSDAECLEVLNRVGITGDSTNASLQNSRAASRVASRAPSIKDGAEGSEVIEAPLSSSASATGTLASESRVTLTLESAVSAGGANFSQGQRQLVALARALIRRAPIIVLDEATSSIDFASDARIQTTIREEFTDSLLLTVAHRLKTVIDYDRLIVLDKGVMAEFDTPLALIEKEDGIFRQMCLQSGMFAELEAAARAKADAVALTTTRSESDAS